MSEDLHIYKQAEVEAIVRKTRIETARKCAEIARGWCFGREEENSVSTYAAARDTCERVSDALLAYAASLEEGKEQG